MSKLFTMGAMTVVVGLVVAMPVFAHSTHSKLDEVRSKLKEQSKRVNDRYLDRAQRLQDRQEQRDRVQKKRIWTKRTEIQKEVEETHAKQASEKLEGSRLTTCEKRQASINALMASSAASSRTKLARIQRVETSVLSFYKRNQLAANTYATVMQDNNDKEAAAIAAIDVAASRTFDCAQVSASDPASTVKAVQQAKEDALNNYKNSVKELIRITKEAFATKRSGGGAS